jgi:enterochelin esterase-like enzyme
MFSKLVLAAVCGAAAAGWAGVRLAPPVDSVAAAGVTTVASSQPGARNRDSWQPSPIPSKQTESAGTAATTSTGSTAAASQPNQQAPARNRAAWQPSPVPSTASTASSASTLDSGTASQAARPSTIVPNGGASLDTAAALAQAQPANPAPSAPPAAPVAHAPATGLAALLQHLPLFNRMPAPATAPTLSAVAAPVDFVPFNSMFTADRLVALFGGELPAERGQWQEVRFYSRALGQDTAYMVWLPPGYDTSKELYPTLYLLHGAGGPEGYGVEEWLGYALTEDLDRMLALGMIEPMIVVLPNGEQGYWMNHADGGPRWADYIAQDLVKHVDATFRTDARRERRAVGGLSMGGHGALQLALNHPDEFAIAGAHSPTLRTYEDSPEFFGDPKWFAQYDPLTLARTTNNAPKIATWIDIGNEDKWLGSAAELDAVLQAKKAPVEFKVLEGEHEGWYWEYYLPEYLNFYSSALHATAKTPQGAPVVVSHSLMAIAGAASPYA